MTERVRTRFAPSPTGYLHVGGARTALFAWAFARANGGDFILRIEDTDQTRLVEGAIDAISESLRWLGIDWDEGPDVGGEFGPYIQSQRLPRYQETAAELIARGRAYACFCSSERLDALRKEQQARKQPPGYDSLCRAIAPAEAAARARDERHVVRFAMDRDGSSTLHDLVRGDVTFENALQDDFVILKSDGFPTYHLAMLVDDHGMEISHVIRAEEWLSSAPKHLQLYDAIGWPLPAFAHLPVIVDTQKRKLSKRSGHVAVLDYREHGYLPEAMINFLAFLGWSLDDKTSLITLDEFRRHFSLERVVPNPAVFDIDRLRSLNGHYLREMPADRWRETAADWMERGLPVPIPRPLDDAVIDAAAPLLHERVALLEEIAPLVEFLFEEEAPVYPRELLSERLGGDEALARRVLEAAVTALEGIDEAAWAAEPVEEAIRGLQDTLDLKLRKFVAVLYVAAMGRPQGIPLFDSLAILGRERTLLRLRTALGKLA